MTRRSVYSRRKAIMRIASLTAASLFPWIQARAQAAYPTKPVRVIVPYSAGGGADTLPAVSDRFAQVTVLSRPNTPAEFGAFVNAEMEEWGKFVRHGNIKPD